MKFRRSLTNLAIGAGVLFATAATAFAAPAVATGSVNVRSGPSTGYARVDTLQRNQLVEVTGCRNGWCYIEKRGPDGWVSANYLDRGGRPGGNGRPDWDRPGWNNGPGWDRPPHWNNPRPPRPPHWNPRPPRPQPWPGYDNGSSVCFNGPNGYFCVGD